MNRLTVFKHSVFATLLLSTALTAFANGGGSAAPRGYPIQNAYAAAGQRLATTAPATTELPVGATGSAAAVQETSAATRDISSGKSRVQVREELVEAQRTGLVPSGRTDYPPSTETIARNQARFQQVEPLWRARGDIPTTGQWASDADSSERVIASNRQASLDEAAPPNH
jgi:hypothetical protein